MIDLADLLALPPGDLRVEIERYGASELDLLMAAVLARLELTSTAQTQAWNASGGHSGEPDDRFVASIGRLDAPHLRLRARYVDAWRASAKREILEDAVLELAQMLRRVAPMIDGKPLAVAVIEDGEGWPAEVVGQRFAIAANFVRRIRGRAFFTDGEAA